jgi:sterol desaturase/sphingolipid hydroxylase (fatty acid hydroxylase superfamily)
LSSLLFYLLPIRLGILVLFTIIERAVPAAGPRKPLRGYLLNFKVTLLDSFAAVIFGTMIGACVAALGARLGLGWIDLRFKDNNVGVLILAALLSTFIYDFFFYWFHLFQHESPILWQEHKLHHMEEQLCAFYRQSPLEGSCRIATFWRGDAIFGLHTEKRETDQ